MVRRVKTRVEAQQTEVRIGQGELPHTFRIHVYGGRTMLSTQMELLLDFDAPAEYLIAYLAISKPIRIKLNLLLPEVPKWLEWVECDGFHGNLYKLRDGSSDIVIIPNPTLVGVSPIYNQIKEGE